ncbi:MAG: hemagglutinin repeat-containing protein, partial [Azoarcus sp.]|nr:hemagglutinin repeat-containing protein [Azoarcus sp.]
MTYRLNNPPRTFPSAARARTSGFLPPRWMRWTARLLILTLAAHPTLGLAQGVTAAPPATQIALAADALPTVNSGGATGALIKGDTVQLQTGALSNAGAIQANELQALVAGKLENTGLIQSRGAVQTEQNQSAQYGRRQWQEQQTTQHGATVSAGGDLTLLAEADIALIASRAAAGGALALQAGGDIDIASAADAYHYEYHRRGGGKKIDDITSTVRQQSAVLEGRDI